MIIKGQALLKSPNLQPEKNNIGQALLKITKSKTAKTINFSKYI